MRRRRADLEAGKYVLVSRNDGVADTSPEAAAKVAAAVERIFGLFEDIEGEAGAGAGEKSGAAGKSGAVQVARSASMMTVMARRYAADMGEASVPAFLAAAARRTVRDAEEAARAGDSPPKAVQDPEDEDSARARSVCAASAMSVAESVLDALGLDPGGDNLGDDFIRIITRGDGAYGSREILQFCYDLAIDPCIRIQRNANLRPGGVGRARPMAVIDQLGGGNPDPKAFYALSKETRELHQRVWKIIAQYGLRWLHEAMFGSFKNRMGGSIRATKPCNMVKEMALKIQLYNKLQDVGLEAIANA